MSDIATDCLKAQLSAPGRLPFFDGKLRKLPPMFGNLPEANEGSLR